MRLTQHTDYSLRVLMYLALDTTKLVTIQEVAAKHQISKNHLMKVVQRLAHGGFITSVRGQGGGMKLQRKATDIAIGEVVQFMEPDFSVVECFRADNDCVITPACRLRGLFAEALEQFTKQLNRYSLADLVKGKARSEMVTLLQLD